jgi:hypothetical protein
MTKRAALLAPVCTVSSHRRLSPTLIGVVACGDAHHFVLDQGGFADAGLGLRARRRAECGR